MNSCELTGRLTTPPRPFVTTNGQRGVNLAVLDERTDARGTTWQTWFQCTAWDDGKSQAYQIAAGLKPGETVKAIGPVTARAFTGQDGAVKSEIRLRLFSLSRIADDLDGAGEAPF